MKYPWLTLVLCAAGCADSEPVVVPIGGTGGATSTSIMPALNLIEEINAKRAEGGTCVPDTFPRSEKVLGTDPVLSNACRTFLDDQVARGTAPLTGDAASDALVQRAFAMGFVGQIIGYHAEIFMAAPEEIVADWLKSPQCPGLYTRDMTVAGAGYRKVPESIRPDRWAILGGFLPPDLESSVLLDDFEDANPDQTFVAAKMGIAPAGGGKWYGHTDPDGVLVGVTNRPLSPREELVMGNRIWDAAGAVGAVGRFRSGLRLATDHVVNWAGMVVELRGPYDQDLMDLTNLKAVSFSARGQGTLRMQIHVRIDDEWYYPGAYVTLSPTWKNYIVTANDLAMPPWQNPNLTWEMVRDRAAMLDFQFDAKNQGFVELYLDNVRLYGIRYWEDYGLHADVE